MGTTCVAMYFLDDALIIGHVGDSRCYRVRGTELTQLTEDHSLINDYIRMKRVTPEEAENWPHKNVIVRALGMKESVQVDILTEKPHLGDTYLLCSDGLTGMLKDDQIQHILMSERDLDRAVERLIDGGERRRRRRQHLGRARAGRGRRDAARSLLAAPARRAGVQEAARRRRRRGAPPPIPATEVQRGQDACKAYVAKVCACTRRPREAAVRAREGAARGDRDRPPDRGEPRIEAAGHVLQAQDSVRKTMKECIEQIAKLPALGCP